MIDSKKLVKELGIIPNKALGQNFLVDEAALSGICELACRGGYPVLEIGPGLGALTYELSMNAPQVVAVEIDKTMVEALNKVLSGRENVKVINRDFLKLKRDELLESVGNRPFSVAANLPYYITSQICMMLIESDLPIRRMVLMMQEEASERFFAKPGSKNYGPLTILSRYLFDVSPAFHLTPTAYYPAPDVNSVVLVFERNANPFPAQMPKILRAAFSMRRKTLQNNMLALAPKPAAIEIIEKSGLPPSIRAETLTPDDFMRLSTEYSAYIGSIL